jgi:hypothetical protein
MSPEMYTLIDQNAFHLNIAPTTATPAYPRKTNSDGVGVCVCFQTPVKDELLLSMRFQSLVLTQ